jgi:hypothetical protein
MIGVGFAVDASCAALATAKSSPADRTIEISLNIYVNGYAKGIRLQVIRGAYPHLYVTYLTLSECEAFCCEM